ncbi:right-handed parallel beta-helix repeat-containing protein [Jannaschia sp. W003]|uniref:right-handed parallel beta-helix repeat-containing protein n=1 Tax=Jannaschia sp. W003 TaxID=2867012 RepID=UPI0021A39E7E|nr:right-handed parallel beta-helix repeat-containing protein [Jannaschia sp. W003]UWQ22098.1 right-handed parallel beta-helix repeat-containing protein [Jannaschia sp. W003]
MAETRATGRTAAALVLLASCAVAPAVPEARAAGADGGASLLSSSAFAPALPFDLVAPADPPASSATDLGPDFGLGPDPDFGAVPASPAAPAAVPVPTFAPPPAATDPAAPAAALAPESAPPPPAPPPAAARDMDARLGTAAAALDAAAEAEGPFDLGALRAAAGMTAPPPAGFPPPRAAPPDAVARAVPFDLRLALAMLSQGSTRADDERVRAAQGARGDVALALEGGVATLDTVREGLRATGLQPEDGPVRVPLVVMPDAVLLLRPGEMLALARAHGAFVLAFGRIEADGARIEAHGPANAAVPAFAPFVAVAGTGSLWMQRTVVTGLGFGITDKYAGLAMLGHPLRPPLAPSAILGSHLRGGGGVVLASAPGVRVEGTRFSAMRRGALRIDASPGAVVAGNLFHGTATTNAIRLRAGSAGARIEGNAVLGGARAAIVAVDSRGVRVADNLVWRRDGGAVKLDRAPCGRVEGNVLVGSRQKGIEVRGSAGVRVDRNLVSGSRSAGIWISAQEGEAVTRLTANRLERNGTGLVGATAARVALRANDFSAQLPRLAGGDLATFSTQLARDLRGAEATTLRAAGAPARNVSPAPACDGDPA